jgi:hypothetical protein
MGQKKQEGNIGQSRGRIDGLPPMASDRLKAKRLTQHRNMKTRLAYHEPDRQQVLRLLLKATVKEYVAVLKERAVRLNTTRVTLPQLGTTFHNFFHTAHGNQTDPSQYG